MVKKQTLLSPIDLYQNFAATDARALVSIQALAALNIHLGGDETISKKALSEFLHNVSFQTEDIYIGDSYTDNYSNFPPLSTDDRKGFKIKINGGDLIAFKSSSLTTVDVSKMQLKKSLSNILEDLNANRKDFTDHLGKKKILKEFKNFKKLLIKSIHKKKDKLKKKLLDLVG